MGRVSPDRYVLILIETYLRVPRFFCYFRGLSESSRIESTARAIPVRERRPLHGAIEALTLLESLTSVPDKDEYSYKFEKIGFHNDFVDWSAAKIRLQSGWVSVSER